MIAAPTAVRRPIENRIVSGCASDRPSEAEHADPRRRRESSQPVRPSRGRGERRPPRLQRSRRRGAPAARVRPIPMTAVATTAAAASSSPRTQPAFSRSASRAQIAIAVRMSADGNVKPSQAASPPSLPARWMPMAIPTWLDDGPGRRLESATSSPNCCSPIQRRRVTYSSRKYPMCATGPPNDVSPSRSATRKTSDTLPVTGSLRASTVARPPPREHSPRGRG